MDDIENKSNLIFSVSQFDQNISVQNLTLYQNCYDQDDLYSLGWMFKNISASKFAEFYSKIIISQDMIFDENDAELGIVYSDEIAAGESRKYYHEIIIPEQYLNGDYYIGLVENSNLAKSNVSWLKFNASIPVDSSNYGQLLTSETWNQRSPWNDYCPYSTTNATSRTMLGCGAVAISQALYILKTPKSLSFDSSDKYSYNGIYIDSSHFTLKFPSFTELNALVSNIKYDGSNEDMAALGFAVAVKLQSEFGDDSTTTYTSAYKDFFISDCNFDSTTWWNYSGKTNADGTWKQEYIDIIAENIKNGTPVILRIDKVSLGHLVMVEDYDSVKNQFYINMGWGGVSDGWYSLNNIDDNYHTTDVFLDIIPEYDNSAIVVNSTADYGIGTLRRAIELSNSIQGANTIVFDPVLAGKKIILDSELTINDQVNIIGLENSGIIISRNFSTYAMVFDSGADNSTISNVIFDGGNNFSIMLYTECENNKFSNVSFQNISGSHALLSIEDVMFDSDCNLNNYNSYGSIIYVPSQVSDMVAYYDSGNLNFSWNYSTDIEDGIVSKYLFEYSFDADFSDVYSTTVTGTSYLLSGVKSTTNYFFRVCGIDKNGNQGTAGEIERIFTGVDYSAPQMVYNLSAKTDDIRATLSWTPAIDSGSGISHYLLEYSINEDFSNATQITTTSTEYRISGLQNNALYFWRVMAVDYEGNVSQSSTSMFTPSADYLVISKDRNNTISTERSLKVLNGVACNIDGALLPDHSAYFINLTSYNSKIYFDGDLDFTNGKYSVYGILGINIVDGVISGSISLETNNTSTICGIRSNNLNLTELSSKMSLTSQNASLGYGIYVDNEYAKINEFSGNINIDMRNSRAYGILTSGKLTIDEWSGSISVLSGNFACGIYNNTAENTQGVIYVRELSGAINVNSKSSATGIYATNSTVTTDDISGEIIVSSEESYVYGIYSNGANYTISGLIITNSLENNCALYSSGGLDITITGSVLACGYVEEGKTYQASSEILKAKLQQHRGKKNNPLDPIFTTPNRSAIISSDSFDDTILLQNDSFVFGNISLGGGEDYILIDSRSEYIGEIYNSGTLDIVFSIYEFVDTTTISTTSMYKFSSAATSLSIVMEELGGGRQTLIKTSDSSFSWGSKKFNLIIGDNKTTISVGAKAVFVDGYSFMLTWENSSELVLTVKDCVPPPAPIVTASQTMPTCNDVTIYATFSEDTVKKEYSYNKQNWLPYYSGVTMTANGMIYFRGMDEAENISDVVSYEVRNIDKTAPVLKETLFVTIVDEQVIITWSGESYDNESGISGYKFRFGKTSALSGEGTTAAGTFKALPKPDNGIFYYQIAAYDQAGNVSNWSNIQSFELDNGSFVIPQEALKSSKEGVSWESNIHADSFIVEYSLDGFESTIGIGANSYALSNLNLPSGIWQWRVCCNESEKWTCGEDIISKGDTELAKYTALEDGNTDLFFVKSIGTWSSGYWARHSGILSEGNLVWNGEKSTVLLTNKNRYADIFEGCNDANILFLSDFDNGDALFVDDIYTESLESIGKTESRIAIIDEIRAGMGDDIVDMTSSRFEYRGNGLTIRGGDGHDTIWANRGSNKLFGDGGYDNITGGLDNDIIIGGAGDDSMHGGGGNDIFAFGGNWGNDIVEQLKNGNVTLWFESGIAFEDLEIANIGDDTKIATENGTILVKNRSFTEVNFRFGNSGFENEYRNLSVLGAFTEISSQKIFEDRGKFTALVC